MVTKKQIENVLKTIPDPEIGVSLWDLGLINKININPSKAEVIIIITLTTIGCPLYDLIADTIRREVGKLPGVESVVVDLTFDPPWTTERMSRKAKKLLGFT